MFCRPNGSDAATALKWVLQRGPAYRADVDRLCIMGESAGANLTAALTYCATHPRPEAFAKEIFDLAPNIRCAVPLYGTLDRAHLKLSLRDAGFGVGRKAGTRRNSKAISRASNTASGFEDKSQQISLS